MRAHNPQTPHIPGLRRRSAARLDGVAESQAPPVETPSKQDAELRCWQERGRARACAISRLGANWAYLKGLSEGPTGRQFKISKPATTLVDGVGNPGVLKQSIQV